MVDISTTSHLLTSPDEANNNNNNNNNNNLLFIHTLLNLNRNSKVQAVSSLQTFSTPIPWHDLNHTLLGASHYYQYFSVSSLLKTLVSDFRSRNGNGTYMSTT